MIHELTLAGCTPTPLAHYLKALGVLRLVAEQADPNARGSWRGGVFRLRSSLDVAALERFFLHDYRPTPLVAPWNGGSGFYPKDNKAGIDALTQSRAPRFAPYGDAIAAAAKLTVGLEESPKDESKVRMLAQARNTWTGGALEWLTAAVVLSSDEWFQFPALLGTGGNDGRLDFTNNFMQRLGELFETSDGTPKADAGPLLTAALFGNAVAGLGSSAVGQFLPGGAGGVNASAGFSGGALVNRWDFVLLLEGAIAFRVAAVRRLDAKGLPQASAPFAVRATAAGYASAASTDVSARGEQWLPLWSGFASWSEVRALFGEARLQSSAGRAQTALDAARAIARLGVARGIEAFERYGFIERNGQSNLAVPLGRWPVVAQPHIDLIDEIEPWLDALRGAAGGKGAPASLGRLVRNIEAAVLAVCKNGKVVSRWQALLVALVEAELALVDRPKATADAYLGPIPRLSPEWLHALGDSPEVRLAAAIASQGAPRGDYALGPIRAHCLPLAAPYFDRFVSGMTSDPRVVWGDGDMVDGLARVVTRRVIDARGKYGLGFEAKRTAPVADVEAFVAGVVDDTLVGRLARGLMALRWDDVSRRELDDERPTQPLLALFRLLHLEQDVEALHAHAEPGVIRLLAAGRLGDATELAVRRLRARGLSPKLRLAAGSAEQARRLAAAMAIPVSHAALKQMIDLVAKPLAQNPEPAEPEGGPTTTLMTSPE